MEYFLQRLHNGLRLFDRLQILKGKTFQFISKISAIGYATDLDDYEKRKLAIFNQLNFFQLLTGVIIPFIAFFSSKKIPLQGLSTAILPAFISLSVLMLNFFRKYQAALLCYFILYPVFTCFIYINGFDLGIELGFVLYGILSVFFLQDIGYMLFAISLSMVSYFILSIAWKDYRYQLELYNYKGYLINHVISIIYIFYGLYLIKRENAEYQQGMTTKNDELSRKNSEIESQKKEILYKAKLLERQTAELNELNKVKDKLFSIISHDLKTPMYALQNLFVNVKKLDLPAREIKSMIPAVVTELNYTTVLLENLLQWAKSQMQAGNIVPQAIDMSELINDTVRLLRLQAEEKKITLEAKADDPALAWADYNMISLVIRNLLSNAIKFTPQNGQIIVGVHESRSGIEVFVHDTGVGISKEAIANISNNHFYTTKGTHNEHGTGLGLALCKEFLEKNGGRLVIETEPGCGSIFSFTLPAAK
ncbi:MAG TPA: HAMP domain-containing sensor histidine kinase [Chitinophagaceae bacterium]